MREFLKGLELDDELVDTIMAEHGKHLTKLKEQNEEYKTKIEKYRTVFAPPYQRGGTNTAAVSAIPAAAAVHLFQPGSGPVLIF